MQLAKIMMIGFVSSKGIRIRDKDLLGMWDLPTYGIMERVRLKEVVRWMPN